MDGCRHGMQHLQRIHVRVWDADVPAQAGRQARQHSVVSVFHDLVSSPGCAASSVGYAVIRCSLLPVRLQLVV